MKIRQTKALESAIARGMLTSHPGDGHNPIDGAFLIIMEEGDCHAAHILGRLLKGWEIYQIKAKIEQELNNANDNKQATIGGREFYDTLGTELEKIAAEFSSSQDPMVNTMHLLIYILRNRNLVSSRVLAMYNVTAHAVRQYGEELPAGEDYYAEMKAMREVRILRINPQRAKGNSDEEESGSLSCSDDDGATDSGNGYAKQTKKSMSGLEKYGTDLTEAARNGAIDPVTGRENEIERLIQILGRRKKNNPVLIGEAGVGKSAIAEGLALRLASRDVPPALQGKTLFSLDLASLVAGTKYRGQFEERIKELMKELKKNSDTILFIDEIHTIVGTGSTQGNLDTANILKPALARGELQCIGATTFDEYRESIENDGALERRFQKIVVEPASKEDTLRILANVKGHYERHHLVKYSDEALTACVELAERYITGRHFPDKAIDILDEAGAKAHLSSMQDSETIITIGHIREVVSMMTGIPVQNVSQSERERLKDMARHLESLVVGQHDAIAKVTRAIQRSRAGLKDPGKPTGVFMFAGPTGVGKTLLAKELSKWMFDRPDALVRIDMSEYSEKHNVSRLIGSPPGYVGYSDGGQLTEAVRRQPYTVVLFDEIEKAHPDVFNIMLQIFDEGHLTDGSGRKIDFRNTVIIMTSNVGSRRMASKAPAIGFDTLGPDSVNGLRVEEEYRKALEETFAPEFINRIDDVVVFNNLSPEDIKQAVDIELGILFGRAEAMGYRLIVSREAREALADMGFEPRYGARPLKRVILHNIEEPLAEMIVSGEIEAGGRVEAAVEGGRIVLRKKKSNAARNGVKIKCPVNA